MYYLGTLHFLSSCPYILNPLKITIYKLLRLKDAGRLNCHVYIFKSLILFNTQQQNNLQSFTNK